MTGATLTLTSIGAPSAPYGSVSARISADTFRLRSVRLSGEIRTTDAQDGASLWLRIDRLSGGVVQDNGQDRAVRGNTEWTHFETTLTVPTDATTIVYGLLLFGTGEATVRNLRLDARRAPANASPTAVGAMRELDSAISIIQSQVRGGDTVSWMSLTARIRAAAAGAQHPAEVYEAIRALLGRVGDDHAMLVPATPAPTAGQSATATEVVRQLPDRIGLVSVVSPATADTAAVRRYPGTVWNSLAQAGPQATCGWIIDLRASAGDDPPPLIEALRPFFTPDQRRQHDTSSGDSGATPRVSAIEPPRALSSLESAAVAVLTGPRTQTPGEVATLWFRDRPNSRSFGLPTAGKFPTRSFGLPDGATLVLSVKDAAPSVAEADQPIVPDALVQASTGDARTDPQIAAAVAWLKSGSCRTRR